jgi:hypothetical protein
MLILFDGHWNKLNEQGGMAMIPINNTDPVLLEELEKARRDWHYSVRQLDFAQEDFVECAVQRINSALAQYLTLLKQAKKCGLTAWDLPLKPLSIETESVHGQGSSITDTAELNQTK